MTDPTPSKDTDKKIFSLMAGKFYGLGLGREETRDFWNMITETGGIRSHVLHNKTHFYFYFDTNALTSNTVQKNKINWGHKTLYPGNAAPDTILTTSNKISIRIARHFMDTFFGDAYNVIAEKRPLNTYEVTSRKKIVGGKKILIVTDVTNSGKSIEGLLNLCNRYDTPPGNVKLFILINRLIGDDWERISKRLPKGHIYSAYKIPIPSFRDNQKHCPLCREIKILNKHKKLSYESQRYVENRLHKIQEKDSKTPEDNSTVNYYGNNKINRGRTLDFLLNKGETGIVEAILNDMPISNLYHVLEALPSKYHHKKEVQTWFNEQIKSTKNSIHLRKLLRAALEHNPQAIIENTAHIINVFAGLEKDGFIVFLYNYLICEEMLDNNGFQNKLKFKSSTDKKIRGFIDYLSSSVDLEIPDAIRLRPSLQSIYKDKILKIADKNINILLTGETGVGKGEVAQLIHDLSDRKHKTMAQTNLTAITDTLMESELFGHVKGSFTGATSDKTGVIERANNSTLFLDEIGEISLNLQVKILNVIQNKKITQVGGVKEIDCDFRLITATNKNLWQAIQKKEFREDLYYRINTVEIEIPPLRNCTDDIEALADHFIDKSCHEFDMKKITNKKEVIKIMKQHTWPGNVRQLINEIKSAVVFSKNGIIALKPLKTKLDEIEAKNNTPENHGLSLRENVKKFEREFIFDTLIKENGNKQAAAARLGIDRATLHNKIRTYKPSTKRENTKDFNR